MADESLLREVADRSPDGLWVTDRGGKELYCNATAARFVGEVGEDGELDRDAMDTLRVLREQALESGSATDDLSSALPGGRKRWVRAYVAVLEREDGDDVVVHRFNDVTADRQLRHDLAESRLRLAAAQELTGASEWVWDLATDRIAMPVLDRDDPSGPERLVDITTYATWVEQLAPEHGAAVRQAAAEALADNGPFDVVFATHDSDGHTVWVHAHGVLEREDGVDVRVHGTFQDVTQIHEAEAELLRQVDRTAILRRVTAAANEHRTFADAAAAVREVMLTGPRCERIVVLVLRDDSLEALDEAPTREESALAALALAPVPFVWSEDRRLLAFAARHEDVAAGVLVVTWATGLDRFTATASAAAAVGAVLGRVAERERAEVVIERALEAATAASRQKSEFLATMSHEIRTPLNGIIGLNDLLLRTSLDADQLRLASGVQAASRALLTLISDVLDFSRIEEGHLRIENVDFEPRLLLDQLARVLGDAARDRGVDLVLVCDDEVPATLEGDPTRLLQVLVHLVANAVKFTEVGQVVVRVGTAAPEHGAGRFPLRLLVDDSGIGVDPSLVPTLFEPFTQGDASSTRSYGGTGLGLAIVRRIVTALGGEVTYAPRPEGGSRFVVDVGLGVSTLGLGALDDYARTWLTGRRVLVVADDPPRLDESTRQLAWWRLRPSVAGSADVLVALERALTDGDPFDAVVLSLPPDAALAAARSIAAAPHLDHTVMLVLASPGTDVEALLETGAAATPSRPVPGDVLRAQLLEHLANVAPQPHERGSVPRRRGHRRLLVVEDNPVNQLVAAGLLESMGFDIDLAGDGAVALAMLEQASYDAVLMDVQMPVLDGYETTRRLRAAGLRLPVVAMTASAVEGERERCLDAGMDDFLTKPVDPVDLAGALDRWLGAGPAAAAASAVPTEEPVAEEALGLPPTPPIAGLDVERLDMLRDIDPGDTSYIDRAIGNFGVNSLSAVETIGTLVAEGDVAAVRAAAHKIAGSALNLGATRAGLAARAVEQLADTGSLTGADELLGELAEAMAEARGLLVTYRATFAG